MLVKFQRDSPEFLAGDHTLLRELLHPAKASVQLGYSLAYGRLAPGAQSTPHRLSSSEVYYFLGGKGRVTIEDQQAEVEKGAVVYVPPGATQFVNNLGENDLEFLCLVDPAWKPEDEEVLGGS